VLVEQRGWFDDQQVAALRSSEYGVRQCTGATCQVPGLPAGQLRAVPARRAGRPDREPAPGRRAAHAAVHALAHKAAGGTNRA